MSAKNPRNSSLLFWLILVAFPATISANNSILNGLTAEKNIAFENKSAVDLAVIDGELRRYHKISLTWNSASSFSETDITFKDFRLNVTFTSPTGKVFIVPGFFAADGNAKETSAVAGTKWRCNFTPLETGIWTYSASFRTGSMIAASFDATSGTPVAPIDGDTGTFSIAETNKSGIDLRSKGKLEYVGEHFQRWTNGEYFMKIGSDSPEVLLEYNDIDDYDGVNHPREYLNHLNDWNPGDPTWQGDKGKGLIGIINYLSNKGINSQYFVLHRQHERSSPFSDPPNSYFSFDVSRMGQWEVVFDHMVTKGMNVHLVLSESTNQSFFETHVPSGDPLFSDARKIYFREIVARFGYLNGVTWNIGEENGWDRQNTFGGIAGRALTTQQQLNFTAYLDGLAYYNDHITVHNGHANDPGIYDYLQGNNSITGTSMQGVLKNEERGKETTQQLRVESAESGKKWVIYYDEAWNGNDLGLTNFRRNVVWAAFTAGAAGIEHYATSGLDVSLQDLRFYDEYYTQMRHAYDFYHDNNLPFHQMYNQDELVENAWAHGINGDNYVVYVETNNAGSTTMRLLGDYEIKWFDPRLGGALQDGSITNVSAGDAVNIGLPPTDTNLDWVALIRTDPNNGPINVTGVTVEPEFIELGVGSSYDIRPQVIPANADNLDLVWSSSDTSIVTVDNQGNILAIGPGNAIVTVTTVDGGHMALTNISVIESTNFCEASGTILMERYDNVPGFHISDLFASPNYPDNPTITQELTEFKIPTRAGDQYGARVSGFLCAPETGLYTFWIAGDDRAELKLSTDDNALNATIIAFNDIFTGEREWNKRATQKSVEIQLRQGDRYYIEAVMKEGSGGDHMTVGWRKPSDRFGEVPKEVIPGNVLSPNVNIAVTGIAVNPEQIEIEIGETAQLIKEVTPSFASNNNVIWTSNNTSLVTVDEFGNIEGIATGTATITATTVDGNFSDETIVTVAESIISVTGITLGTQSEDIVIGEILDLAETISPSNASNQSVVWTSSDPTIVTVDTDGTITGISEGTATITATTVDGNFSDETTVTVTEPIISVTGITLGTQSEDIVIGEILDLTETISPSNASNQSVVWTSSDPTIVTVDTDGTITGISEGTATITATTVDGNFSDETTVTVTEPIISVTGITLGTQTEDIVIGEILDLTETISPSNASNQSVVWTSSDPTIVTVDSDGTITGISEGTATITVTTADGSFSAETIVGVTEPIILVTGVTLDKSNIVLDINELAVLVAMVQPNNATEQEVIWSSSDPTIATVDSDGNVLALMLGTATITATTLDGGHAAEATVVVSENIINVINISIDPLSVTLDEGDLQQLNATIEPANATNQSISWTSDDASIVSVNSDGLIMGLQAGSTQVNAISDDGSFVATVTVTVNAVFVAVTGVSLNQSSIVLEVGEINQIIASIEPANASNSGITWISLNETIASVDQEGNIVGLATGTTVISAETADGSFRAEVTVEVLDENASVVEVSHIAFDFDSIDLEIGESFLLNPTFSPANAQEPTIIWTTADNTIVQVNPNGSITGLAVGTSVIKGITENGLSVELTVNVLADEILMVYPNPAEDYIIVTGVSDLIFLSIYTSNGQLLNRVRTSEGGTRISVKFLPPGVYLLGLDNGRKVAFVKQ